MTENRRALHVNLSPEAYDRWADKADELGVSLSALAEVAPEVLQSIADNDRVYLAARRLDAHRRRRTRN